jgi:tetratricopeptide (TPR) repeat protein
MNNHYFRLFFLPPFFMLLFFAPAAFAQTDYLKQCIAYNDTNHDAQALAFCTKAIEADPGSEDAYFNRAIVYQRQKNFAAAIADQSKLIEMTGFAMFYVYRAELNLKQGRPEPALADLNIAISKKPAGIYGARAYYYRGTINETRGKTAAAIADYESANKLVPGHYESTQRLAVLKPAQANSIKLPPLPQPTQAAALKAGWKRMELTGTGLSVGSPAPFELKQDKADPLMETQTAYVFWTLSNGGVFATVMYKRSTDGKTPRQDLEEFAKMADYNDPDAAAKVADTTFLGKPAVQYNVDYIDDYTPGKPKKKRRMIEFGSGGEITGVQVNYLATDLNAAAIADQIFSSFQTGGAVAQSISKMPPANWQWFQLHGLKFQVPSTETEAAAECGQKYLNMPAYESSAVCYKWGKSPIADVAYRHYFTVKPSMKMLADAYVRGMKDIDADSKQNFLHQYTVEAVSIPGAAEAFKVKAYTGYGTAGDNEEITFIKRGDNEVWVIHTYEFIRWDFTKDAVKKITASLQF